MAAPRNPPFRAEHLGSLLRPEQLLKTRDAAERGEVPQAELTALQDAEIKKIVDVQKELGYHALTDGEYRRHMFWGSFFNGLEGMTEIQEPSVDLFRHYLPDIAAFLETKHKPAPSCVCTRKIKHVGSTYVDQFSYLKSLVPPEEVKNLKLTVAAPNWYHLRYREGLAYPKDVYSSDKEYFADVAKAYQDEFEILYNAGLRNIQFDDPNLAYFCSESMLQGWKEDKLNVYTADELLDEYIKLYNDCISKCPADMHVGVHLCRGNFVKSRHFSEGGYDRIAIKLFQELNVNTYYLEYDTPRAGGFEPLKLLPKDKNVIVGVVTSKFPELEDFGEMKQRVLDAAKFVAEGSGQTVQEALRRMGVSPQCGFASHSEGNAIDHAGMVGKLKLVRQLADDIWPGEP
ncbi:hypothetical protein AJ80_07982 [Polytolypa hystricis UAMH7299]|uniref:Cobalamin-independent methionine synthase MetE C-terminal/archaeal domain-containing protein n=1 Tax=Polytolypa hystricis (strain UAMH7299) TaxID=1447883 RepID=A0A2B7XFR2_POLH7|nr:hypothetical protein AJ80_07982 [Polytolypa hystricis UAMH7299]